MTIENYLHLVSTLISILTFIAGFWISKYIENHKTKNQLRSAAIEKRLIAHQECYTRWSAMLRTLETDNFRPALDSCLEWWYSNCLFLEPKARAAFSDAISSSQLIAFNRRSLSESEFNNACRKLMNAGALISAAIDLPPITEVFKKYVD
ncbi:hypothetical protein [Chromobacterium piscinae]|uniref:hypothetical protein n=1 Tax=Chromobacterium piscinae TaxID=686831 RepID=UPI00320A720F